MNRPRPFSLKPIYTRDTTEQRIHAAFTSPAGIRRKGRAVHVSIPMLLSMAILLLAIALLIISSNQ